MTISEIENEDIKIKKVNVKADEAMHVADPLRKNNFMYSFIGGPGSGKTTSVISLLTSKKKCKKTGLKCSYRGIFDKIFLYTGSRGTLPKEEFLDKLNDERIHDNLETLHDDIDSIKGTGEKVLFIIDDLVADLNNKKYQPTLLNLAYNRRHLSSTEESGGCSIIIISQKLNKIPLQLRVVSDGVFFWNWSNKRENDALFNDYCSSLDRNKFDEIIKYISKQGNKHNFLYIKVPEQQYFKNFNKLILDA